MKSNSFSGRAVPFLLLLRNKDFVQGKLRYPAIKDRAGIVLMLLLLVTFLTLAALLGYDKYRTDQLAAYGKVTTAKVVDRFSSSGKNVIYSLRYEYQVATSTYHNLDTVNGDIYNQHPEGSQVSITYLPNDPGTSQLTDTGRNPNYLTGQLLAIVLPVFIGLGGLIYFVWPIYTDRRLTNGGSIIKGKIVERQGQFVAGKRRYYELTVTYDFVSPTDGATLTGTQSQPRNDLKPDEGRKYSTNLPVPGAAIAVLYLDNEHYKML